MQIEMIKAKALRTLHVYSLFWSEQLNTNIKLTLHKEPIRSIVTYACRAWQLVANT
jgi:hypothetical protein